MPPALGLLGVQICQRFLWRDEISLCFRCKPNLRLPKGSTEKGGTGGAMRTLRQALHCQRPASGERASTHNGARRGVGLITAPGSGQGYRTYDAASLARHKFRPMRGLSVEKAPPNHAPCRHHHHRAHTLTRSHAHTPIANGIVAWLLDPTV